MHLSLVATCLLVVGFACKNAQPPVAPSQKDEAPTKTAQPITNNQSVLAPTPTTTPTAIDTNLPTAGGPAVGGDKLIYVPRMLGGGGQGGQNLYVHYVPNSFSFWTDPNFATTYLLKGCTGDNCVCTPGTPNCEPIPAFANIVLEGSNFVWCKGGPYAVCYYSGPSDGDTDLSCTRTADGRFANCKCFEVPWGVYFVDINAILNYDIGLQTRNVCKDDGSACVGGANINKAPVCEAINRNHFIPGADLVSTFSLSCVPTNGLGQTDCPSNVYAGCMTAPCQRTATPGIVECSCPTYDGPYQVGTALASTDECTLGDKLVWSAAYSPSGSTIPPTSPCIPDAPGGNGCPLYEQCETELPDGTDCVAICEAYSCTNALGIEPAYTCDATLCTGECNERQILEGACEGLGDCPPEGLVAIGALESAAGCSCCASQLCNCEPSPATNNAIADFNQRQRELSITPQCDINGTLCGSDHTNAAPTRVCK